jgi:hypothetical protein
MMKDYRLDGPDDARRIIRENPGCSTMPNATGVQCTCDYACANYCLRAAGFKADK